MYDLPPAASPGLVELDKSRSRWRDPLITAIATVVLQAVTVYGLVVATGADSVSNIPTAWSSWRELLSVILLMATLWVLRVRLYAVVGLLTAGGVAAFGAVVPVLAEMLSGGGTTSAGPGFPALLHPMAIAMLPLSGLAGAAACLILDGRVRYAGRHVDRGLRDLKVVGVVTGLLYVALSWLPISGSSAQLFRLLLLVVSVVLLLRIFKVWFYGLVGAIAVSIALLLGPALSGFLFAEGLAAAVGLVAGIATWLAECHLEAMGEDVARSANDAGAGAGSLTPSGSDPSTSLSGQNDSERLPAQD